MIVVSQASILHNGNLAMVDFTDFLVIISLLKSLFYHSCMRREIGFTFNGKRNIFPAFQTIETKFITLSFDFSGNTYINHTVHSYICFFHRYSLYAEKDSGYR